MQNDPKKGAVRPALRIERLQAMLETKLEDEVGTMELLVSELAKGHSHPELWDQFHRAAARDDLLAEVAFAYEQVLESRRMRVLPPGGQAEVLMHAAVFAEDVFGDLETATTCLERVLALSASHDAALGRLEKLVKNDEAAAKMSDRYLAAAGHRQNKPEQLALLRKAADLVATLPGELDRIIRVQEEMLRLYPGQADVRRALEQHYLRGRRFPELAKLLEQSLSEEGVDARDVHTRLLRLYSNQLEEPERALPHLEEVLRADPGNLEARLAAEKLLSHRGAAARAAGALADAHEQQGEAEQAAAMLTLQLETVRGARRTEVQRRLASLRDQLGDQPSALAMLEALMATEAADDQLRGRFLALSRSLGKTNEAARALSRAMTSTREPASRAKIGAELGELLVDDGETKRARIVLREVLEARADDAAVLSAARSMAKILADGQDPKAYAGVLELLAENEPEPEARWDAAAKLARLSDEALGDRDKSITAWKALVDSPLRAQALEALTTHYEAQSASADLAGVLETRAAETADPDEARVLAFRAAELKTDRDADTTRQLAIWRSILDVHGPSRQAHARAIPLMEAMGKWDELAAVLEAEMALAGPDEQANLQIRLARLRLERLNDALGGMQAYARVLAADPQNRGALMALEELLEDKAHKNQAAELLERAYRVTSSARGLARVLEIRAEFDPDATRRRAALEEAVDLLSDEAGEPARAFELAADALELSVGRDPSRIVPWLTRVEALLSKGAKVDPEVVAARLVEALGDRVIEGKALASLAQMAAEAHFAAGEISQAVSLYERLLEREATPERQARLRQLVIEHGSAQDRAQLYRSLLDDEREPQARRNLFVQIAQLEQEELGNAAAAVATLRRALDENASDADLEDALLGALATSADGGALYTELERCSAKAGGDRRVTLLLRMAEVAGARGDTARALEHYREVLHSRATDGALFERIERVAAAANQGDIVLELYERRIALTPDRVERAGWLERLGEVQDEQLGDRKAAVSSWKRAARLCEEVATDVAKARRLYERALRAAPDDVEAAERLLVLGNAEGEAGAMPLVYATLLRNATDERVAFERLLEFEDHAIRAGSVDEFCRTVDDMLARHMAGAAERAGDLLGARARVLAAHPDRRGEADEVLGKLERSTRGDLPSVGEARRGQSWMLPWSTEEMRERRVRELLAGAAGLEMAGLIAEATEAYRNVLSQDPNRPDARFALARLLPTLGDAEGALAAIESLSQDAEPRVRAALELQAARLHLDHLGRTGEALRVLERRLDESPSDAALIPLLERALGRPEVRGRAAALLERACSALEDPSKAATLLEALLSGPQDAPELAARRRDWYLALLERRAGEPEAALAVALRAVRELPEDEELWAHAEQFARHLDQPMPVADAFRQALASCTDPEVALRIGRRAVEFQEEWFEDADTVISLLSGTLEHDPNGWALDRLKLLYSGASRWDEFFALYDVTVSRTADENARADLLTEAAAAAKDVAKDPTRAIGYLERLSEIGRADEAALALLERLYERCGQHDKLISLLTSRLPEAVGGEGLTLRARIAQQWLARGDEVETVGLVHEMLAEDPQNAVALDLLARIVLPSDLAPPAPPARFSLLPSVPPPPLGEEPVTMAPPANGGSTRRHLSRAEMRRAAEQLRKRYERGPVSERLVAVTQVLLETSDTAEQKIAHHRELCTARRSLGNEAAVFDHLASLIALEPTDADHPAAFVGLADSLNQHERAVSVLLEAAAGCAEAAAAAPLVLRAAVVCRDRMGEADRAIELFARVMRVTTDESLLLSTARQLEPLLTSSGRDEERCDVLERIAALETDSAARRTALATAAAVAARALSDRERAIRLRREQLALDARDREALDALIGLLEEDRRLEELAEALERRATIGHIDEAHDDRVRVARMLAGELGRPEESVEAWRRVRQQFGPDQDTFEALSALFDRLSRWGDLSALLEEQAAATAEVQERVSLYGRLGDLLRDRVGATARATSNYREALALDPRDDTARRGLLALVDRQNLRPLVIDALARAYVETGEWDRAAELARAMESPEDVPEELARAFWWGVALHERDVRGELVPAEKALERALSHAPTSLELLSALAGLQRRTPARPLVDTLVKLSAAQGDDLALLREAIEVALSVVGDRALATQLIEKTLAATVPHWNDEDDPFDASEAPRPREVAAWALDELVRLAHDDGDHARVVQLLERGAAMPFATSEVRRMRRDAAALRSERLDDAAGAIALYQSLAEEDPSDAIAEATFEPLAKLYQAIGAYSDLVALWESRAKARTDARTPDAAQHWARAAALAEEHCSDLDRALLDHDRAADLGHVPSLEELARIFSARDDHAAEARALERLCRSVDVSALPPIALRLANAWLAAGDRSAARGNLERAFDRAPSDEALGARLADLYREEQEWTLLARLHARQAERCDDAAAKASRLREAADLHLEKRGDPAAAIPLLEEAVGLSPQQPELTLTLGDALCAVGRPADAAKVLAGQIQRYGARRPKQRALVHFALARVLMTTGEGARALSELDAAARIDPTHVGILHTLAQVARQEGGLERAQRTYQALLLLQRRTDEGPGRAEILLELAKIAEQLDDRTRAGELRESAEVVKQTREPPEYTLESIEDAFAELTSE